MAPYTHDQVLSLLQDAERELFPNPEHVRGSVEHFKTSGPLTIDPSLGVMEVGYEVPSSVVYSLWCIYVPLFGLGKEGLHSHDLGTARGSVRRLAMDNRIGKGMRRACLVWMSTGKLPMPGTCYRVRDTPTWYWRKEHPMLLPLTDSVDDWPTVEYLERVCLKVGVPEAPQADVGAVAEEEADGEGVKVEEEDDDLGEDVEGSEGSEEEAEGEGVQVEEEEDDDLGEDVEGSEGSEEEAVEERKRGREEESVEKPPMPQSVPPTPMRPLFSGAEEMERRLLAMVRSSNVVVYNTLLSE
jgi:hypothetical protein